MKFTLLIPLCLAVGTVRASWEPTASPFDAQASAETIARLRPLQNVRTEGSNLCPFDRVVVSADGNCQFAAISLILNAHPAFERSALPGDHKATPQTLRNLAAQAIAKADLDMVPVYKESLILDSQETRDGRLSQLKRDLEREDTSYEAARAMMSEYYSNDQAWGDDITLAVLSKILDVDFFVRDSRTGVMRAHTSDVSKSAAMFLDYDGVHYNPMFIGEAPYNAIFSKDYADSLLRFSASGCAPETSSRGANPSNPKPAVSSNTDQGSSQPSSEPSPRDAPASPPMNPTPPRDPTPSPPRESTPPLSPPQPPSPPPRVTSPLPDSFTERLASLPGLSDAEIEKCPLQRIRIERDSNSQFAAVAASLNAPHGIAGPFTETITDAARQLRDMAANIIRYSKDGAFKEYAASFLATQSKEKTFSQLHDAIFSEEKSSIAVRRMVGVYYSRESTPGDDATLAALGKVLHFNIYVRDRATGIITRRAKSNGDGTSGPSIFLDYDNGFYELLVLKNKAKTFFTDEAVDAVLALTPEYCKPDVEVVSS